MLLGAHSCIVCIAAAIARNLQTNSGSNALDVAYNRSIVYCVQHTIIFFDCVRRTVKNTNFTVCKGVYAATNAINDCHINYDPARLNQRNFFNNASIGWGHEQPCRSFVFINFCSAWSRSGGQQNSGVYSTRAIEILKFHQIWSLPSFDRVCRLFAAAETCPNRYNRANLTSIHRTWAFHKSESLFYWNSHHFEGIAGVGSGYEKISDSRMPLKIFYTWSHALCKPRGVPQIPIYASRGSISFARSWKFRSEDSGILMVCGGQFGPLQTLLKVLGETNQAQIRDVLMISGELDAHSK